MVLFATTALQSVKGSIISLIFTEAQREARDAAFPLITGKELKPTEEKRLTQGHTPSKE